MSIKKYFANKDNTITNAFTENMINRGIDGNMGSADSLEVFSIFGQTTTSSLENTRILIEFPINEISSSRASGSLPNSGSVSFFLRMYNVEHPFSVPRDFTLSINPVSKSWEEGYGLDMEGYTDKGFTEALGGYGSTWIHAASGSTWETQGGDFITGSGYNYEYKFTTGLEDIDLDITGLVEKWISSEIQNNGLIIRLSSSLEDGSRKESFYTKKFSARGSEYYMRRPCLEARWDPSVTDDRNNFYASSNLLSADDNKMNIYFYNKYKGKLKNIYSDPTLEVKFYNDSDYLNEINPTYLSVTNPESGVYKATVILDSTASVIYDKWINSSVTTSVYYSSSFDLLQRVGSETGDLNEYIVHITNMKSSYGQYEKARFNIFVRERDWQPTIYTVAYNNIENTSIPNLYYKIFRINDNYTVIDYSTGSLAYTKTSYDTNGNYFDLDMNILEKDYGYGIKLALWDGTQLLEFKNTFKFRID